MNHFAPFRLPALAVILLATACASTPGEQPGARVAAAVAARAPGPAIDGLHQPRTGLYTGGQPVAAAWQAMAAQGVDTVINLRPDAELGARDEAAEVRAAGMAYRVIPVAGAADITLANAARLWAALAETPGTTAVHCSSGNRVGALLAIGAATQGGMDNETAIAFGRAAGLGGAEARVREVLAERSAQ
jgi:uncharacterized protein (TIGR01244 family)